MFELSGTTSNMYFVHVDFMNSVLYLLYLRLELSGHLNNTVQLTSMPSWYKRTSMYVFSYLTIFFDFILCSILKTAIESSI